MTAKELRRILKKVGDNTEILIGNAEILRVERKFIGTGTFKEMQLVIIPK